MARNRKKHTNPLPVSGLARCVVALAFLGLCGLSFVAFKNQMHMNGGTIHKLEAELLQLRNENEVVRASISRLSSRPYLQKRLESGFITMIPIANDRIVRLDDAHSGGSNAIRAVANRGGSE